MSPDHLKDDLAASYLIFYFETKFYGFENTGIEEIAYSGSPFFFSPIGGRFFIDRRITITRLKVVEVRTTHPLFHKRKRYHRWP